MRISSFTPGMLRPRQTFSAVRTDCVALAPAAPRQGLSAASQLDSATLAPAARFRANNVAALRNNSASLSKAAERLATGASDLKIQTLRRLIERYPIFTHDHKRQADTLITAGMRDAALARALFFTLFALKDATTSTAARRAVRFATEHFPRHAQGFVAEDYRALHAQMTADLQRVPAPPTEIAEQLRHVRAILALAARPTSTASVRAGSI